MPRLLILLATLSLALPGMLSAQVQGRVVDSDGEAVEGATVELWSVSRRLSARITGSDGTFSFPDNLTSNASGLYVGRMGFRSVQIPLQAGRTEYEVTLATEAIALTGFVVEASEELCFDREQKPARELWRTLRAKYSHGIDTVGVATYLASAELVVPIGEVGPVQLPEFSPGQRGSNSLLRFSWRRYIEKNGYARPVRRTDLAGSYDSWTYPPLDADFATHFIDDLFGELHKFRIEAEDAGGWTVGFCAEDPGDDKPWLTGRLRIAPDTTLQWAEWLFRTREPREGAGGRAVFAEVTPDPARRFLLPSEGLFYRRTSEEELLQRYQRFEGWIVAEGDSVPFLPLREAVSDSTGAAGGS